MVEGSGVEPLPGDGRPIRAGEFVLDYPSETGVPPRVPAPDVLGRNGTYVVPGGGRPQDPSTHLSARYGPAVQALTTRVVDGARDVAAAETDAAVPTGRSALAVTAMRRRRVCA
ncbi:hypothetical protein ACFXPN_05860 [Streptomyces griseorubiginosus]|uniref:hypothetical protein n=1 Tax=Streptomyces griseorubiginosus TaxID=67304 RepID=UPI0036A79360